MLEIRLFGPASVTVAGQPVKFAKRATTLTILARVIFLRGAPISRDSLAFTLFPESGESAALAELRRYLYLLTKALPEPEGEPWLVVDAETIRWNDASGASVDVFEFERCAAHEATHARAIGLYAGDLLEEIYDDWVVAERERLRTRYLAILTESLDRQRARRDYAEAIATAKRLLATDPWREDAVRALLAVRYESGDTAGALAEFDAFAKRLRDELEVAPMPETIAVRQSILRNDAVPGSLDPRPLPGDDVPRRRTPVLPFVGRRRELAIARAAWTRAARGAGALLAIGGEAGAGKTRLAGELSRIVQAEGGRVFVGTTAAPESMPYQPIVEALRSGLPLLTSRPPEAARRAVLATVLPELRDPAAAATPLRDASAERESARLHDAFAHAVRTLASPRPLMLVLEDLQWAGPATHDALAAVLAALRRAPVLVVVTYRDEETGADHPLRALLRSMRVAHDVEELVLERLAEDDVAELVRLVDVQGERAAGATPASLDAADLFALSEGNALFLNEAISGALDRGERVAATLQPSIAAVIAARVERLSDDAQTVAEIAAVVGPGCSVRVVREVANVPAASVARGFDELLDRRILREAGARSSFDYVFTHHLIAQAVYDKIEPTFRAQRHSRIGRVLEAEYRTRAGASAREIARHFERAGDPGAGSAWSLAAARQAADVHAYDDAIVFATTALRDAASDSARREALEVRERARERRGDRLGQRADIDELEALAGDDPRLLFEAIGRRILLTRTLGESDFEGALIDRLEAVARELGDEARAQTLLHRAAHAGYRSLKAEGLTYAREALAIYDRLGDRRGQFESLYLLVDFATNVGDLAAARGYLELMSERAASLADRVIEGRALAVAATAALLRQAYRESYELSKRGLEINLATNDREGEAASRGRLAVTAAWLGEFSSAIREFDLALDSYESTGHKRGIAITHTNRAVLFLRLGLFDEALDSIERANAYFDVVQEQRTIVANLVNASFVWVQRGDGRRAKALADSALAPAREIGFPVFVAGVLASIGNAERVLGEFDAAIAHMEEGIALRRAIQGSAEFVDDLADLTLAYAAGARTTEAVTLAHELEALGTGGFDGAFWPHYIWWSIAAGLHAGGEHPRAHAARARAREEADRFAAGIDDDRARAAFLDLPITARILAVD